MNSSRYAGNTDNSALGNYRNAGINQGNFSTPIRTSSYKKRLDEIETLLGTKRQTPLQKRNPNDPQLQGGTVRETSQNVSQQSPFYQDPNHFFNTGFPNGASNYVNNSSTMGYMPQHTNPLNLSMETNTVNYNSGTSNSNLANSSSLNAGGMQACAQYVDGLEQEAKRLATQYEHACEVMVKTTFSKDCNALKVLELEKRMSLIKEQVEDRNTLLTLFMKGSFLQMSSDFQKKKETLNEKINNLNSTITKQRIELESVKNQREYEQSMSAEVINKLEATLKMQNDKISGLLETIPLKVREQMEAVSSQSNTPEKEAKVESLIVPMEEQLRSALQIIWKEKEEKELAKEMEREKQKKMIKEEESKLAKQSSIDYISLEFLLKRSADFLFGVTNEYTQVCREKSEYARYEMELIRLVEEKKSSIKWQSMFEEKRSEVKHLEENVRILKSQMKLVCEKGASALDQSANYKQIEKPFLPEQKTHEAKKESQKKVPLRSIEELKKDALLLGARPAQLDDANDKDSVTDDGSTSTGATQKSVTAVSTPDSKPKEASPQDEPKPAKLQIKKIKTPMLSNSSESSSSETSESGSSTPTPKNVKKNAATENQSKSVKLDTDAEKKLATVPPKINAFDASSSDEDDKKEAIPVEKEKGRGKTQIENEKPQSPRENNSKKEENTKVSGKIPVAKQKKRSYSSSSSDSSLSLSLTSEVNSTPAKKKVKPLPKRNVRSSSSSSSDTEMVTPTPKKTKKRSSFDEETPVAKNKKKVDAFDEDTPKISKVNSAKLKNARISDGSGLEKGKKEIRKVDQSDSEESNKIPKAEMKPKGKGGLKLPSW